MTVVETKVCPHCKRDLPLTAEFYHRDKHTPSGFKVYCKDCCKKKWNKNKDKYNARAKEYYRENIDRFRSNNPTVKSSTGQPHKSVRLKKEAVKRLGNACECCGVTGPLTILQFHHRDPKTKLGNWGWMSTQDELVRNAELDKCSLLCANCHAGYHSGFVEYDEWSGYKWKEPLEYKYRTVA